MEYIPQGINEGFYCLGVFIVIVFAFVFMTAVLISIWKSFEDLENDE